MSSVLSTCDLHRAFLSSLDGKAKAMNNLRDKPLLLDLELPLPPRIRLYMYNLVGGGGTTRDYDHKASLRLRGHPVGQYRTFDHSGGRLAIVAAYRSDLDVFIFWDAALHRFKNGTNIQVQNGTVFDAATTGFASQERRLKSGIIETVFACTSGMLPETLIRRVDHMNDDPRN